MLKALHTIRPSHTELVLHVASSYVPEEGAGVGVVQQARYFVTGSGQQIAVKRRTIGYGLTRKEIEQNMITSCYIAEFHAVTRGLAFAYQTIKASQGQKITSVHIYCKSEVVAALFDKHILAPEKTVPDIANMQQRWHLRKIISRARKIMRYNIVVQVTCGQDSDEDEKRGRTLARQKGTKACRSRRRVQR